MKKKEETKSQGWMMYAAVGFAGVVAIGLLGKLFGGKKSENGRGANPAKLNKDEDEDNFYDFNSSEEDQHQIPQSKQGEDWETLLSRAEKLKSEGKFGEADKCYEKAYETIKRVYGDEHVYIGLLLSTWAPVLTFLQKYEKAKTILNQALVILGKDENSEFRNPSQIVEIYANLGEICIKLQQYKEAKQYLQTSIDKCEDKDSDPNVGVSRMNMAEVLLKEKKYAESIESCNQAIEIFKQHLPPSHPVILQTKMKILSVYVEQGDIDSADKKFEELIEEQANNNDPSAKSTTTLFLQQRASINFEFERFEEAEEIYKKAIESTDNQTMKKHISNELSCLYRATGREEEADELLKEIREGVEQLRIAPSSNSRFFQVITPNQFTVTYTEKASNKNPWPIWASYSIGMQIKRHPATKKPRLKVGNIITLTLLSYDESDVIVDDHSDTKKSRVVLTESMINGEKVTDRQITVTIDAVRPKQQVYVGIVKIYENEEDEKIDEPIEGGVLKQLSISKLDTQTITISELKNIKNQQRRN